MDSFQESEVERAARYFGEALVGDLRRQVDHLRRQVEAMRREGRADGERREAGPAYLNQRQAAEFLGYSVEFIRRQRRAGTFPEPIRLGLRDLRWSETTLRTWAEGRNVSGGEEVGEAVDGNRRS